MYKTHAARIAELLVQRTAEVNALREELAPLFDDPYRCVLVGEDEATNECIFCGDTMGRHDASCAWLRRDVLLGRKAVELP